MVLFLLIVLSFTLFAWSYSVRKARQEQIDMRAEFFASVDQLNDELTYTRQDKADALHAGQATVTANKLANSKRFRLVHYVVNLTAVEVQQVNDRLRPFAKTLTGGQTLAPLLESNNHSWLLYLIEDTDPKLLDMLDDVLCPTIKHVTGRNAGDAPVGYYPVS